MNRWIIDHTKDSKLGFVVEFFHRLSCQPTKSSSEQPDGENRKGEDDGEEFSGADVLPSD